MRRNLFITGLFVLLSVSAFKSTSPDQVFTTSLRVTVLDELGNIVENAQVTLYGNRGDYEKGENAVAGPELSDPKGRITFKDLESKSYYIQAKKGDRSNYGGGEITDVMAKNKLNKLNIVISE